MASITEFLSQKQLQDAKTAETNQNNSSWKRVDESIWLEKDTCYKNVINRMIESAIKNKSFSTLGACKQVIDAI